MLLKKSYKFISFLLEILHFGNVLSVNRSEVFIISIFLYKFYTKLKTTENIDSWNVIANRDKVFNKVINNAKWLSY